MNRVKGALFGVAFGDALGAPTEFMSIEKIARQYGPRGPRTLPEWAEVTDDTQMMLAVGDALASATRTPEVTAQTLEPRLRDRFLTWWDSPENDRAPGGTCMSACRRMAYGAAWSVATDRNSKGCGANMRVVPMGLARGLTDEQRSGAAQLQAAMTHGHPTALAASDLTAFAVHELANGAGTEGLLSAMLERTYTHRYVYHDAWLGDLWKRRGVGSPEEFIATGWDACFDALIGLDEALGELGPDADPCEAGGGGWVAEQALATATYCLLRFPEDPVGVIARAAASSGDSDSIAAIAGGLAGAAYGAQAWPAEWFEQIEYSAELDRLSQELYT